MCSYFSVHVYTFLDRTPNPLLISELSTMSKRLRIMIPQMQTEQVSTKKWNLGANFRDNSSKNQSFICESQVYVRKMGQ